MEIELTDNEQWVLESILNQASSRDVRKDIVETLGGSTEVENIIETLINKVS